MCIDVAVVAFQTCDQSTYEALCFARDEILANSEIIVHEHQVHVALFLWNALTTECVLLQPGKQ